MRVLAASLAALLTSATIGDSAPDRPKRDFALRCGRLYVTPGQVVDDCWLVVRDGKVDAVLRDDTPPADLPIVDASDKVVMAGIVAADTDLSGHGDDRYNVTPDFVALDGFDFTREYRRPLSGGVTSVYLAPGRNRLVPGQGSVVKLHGEDLVERVLAENACLRVTLGEPPTQAPPIFEPTISPSSEDPLEPARRQLPSSRLAQLRTLRELFREAAAAPEDALIGTGSAEDRYDPDALARAARGDLRLRVAAREAADVRRALQLGADLGQPIVLEDPWDIAPVASLVARRGASAVFRVPVQLGARNPGGEDRRDEQTTNDPANPGIAADAGIPVAIAPIRAADLDDYLMIAGVAVRYGLDPEAALAAITSTAAEILGVADRVGTLEPGKDADFVVLSGAPLAIGTLVEETWIDGVIAYEREVGHSILAVKAGRILTGDGTSLRDGVVILADGRIRAVGEQLAVPFGARIVDLGTDAVITPGFVDAYCSVGLSGEGTGVPAGEPDQLVGKVVEPGDPTFEPVRASGITTVFTSGRDAALVSGRVAAIKTAGENRQSMIVDDTLAQRFVFDAVDPQGVEALKQQIERGKKYREAWDKYAKALADWEAGKTTEKPKESAPKTEEAKPDPLSGVWECKLLDVPMPVEITVRLELKLDGEQVNGRALVTIPSPGPGELPPADVTGTFKSGKLEIEITIFGQTGRLVADVADDRLEGSITGGPQNARVEGTRTKKGGAVVVTTPRASGADGKPEKPKVDEKLEPIRELLEGKATAVVRCQRAPAIRTVIELMRAEKIRFVLHGAADAVDTPEILGEDPPVVVLGSGVVERDGGEIVNSAARLVDAGVPVALSTGDVLGSRFLPLHAAHAVRYGLDADSALRALTVVPARAFGLDNRIGSLARGKDADLVAFSGNPFEMTSRVLLVVCNGRIVHDGRPKEDLR